LPVAILVLRNALLVALLVVVLAAVVRMPSQIGARSDLALQPRRDTSELRR
jgi:hypothetical protein